ncbi:MAG: hypothetical protein ACC608_08065 [Anaerofustis sp.]
MSKLTNIKSAILSLEGGAFQEFCDAYLSRKGYKEIFELGMKSGTMKTTIGNPDTYFKNSFGKYIFVCYTTQTPRINEKIKEDISKCLKEELTGVPFSDIAEIICCHTSSTLKVGEDKHLNKLCNDKGIDLNLFSVDRIANEVYQYYKILAKDFLGIEVDTGQISDADEFIRRYDSNEMAAPISTVFQFREKELTEILDGFQNSNVLVLFGKPGVGKTKLALEVGKRFSIENDYKFLCIKSNDLSIFNDLVDYIDTPGKYLILVDDANELVGLKYVLSYLNRTNEGYDIKIIATVRDYAKEKVISEIKEFTVPSTFDIVPFSDDEMRKFIETNLNIRTEIYIEQILRISKGNPRIAYMAGKLANEHQNLQVIQDATGLYSTYYEKFLNQTLIITDKKICISAAIISLFSTINFDKIEMLDAIFDVAKLAPNEFVENINLLYKYEFVEIHYDKVAKITDQCLANYVLYYAFIVKKIIPLSELLYVGFKSFKKRIINTLSIFTQVFNSEQNNAYLVQAVEIVWDKYEAENEELFLDFMKTFQMVRPNEVLIYVKNRIDNCEECHIDYREIKYNENSNVVSDGILLLLTDFRDSEYLENALQLIVRYAKKRHDLLNQIFHLVSSNYTINKYSHHNDYLTLKKVSSIFSGIDKNDIVLSVFFVKVSSRLLSLTFESGESVDYNTYRLYQIPIQHTEGSREYRRNLWKKLIELSGNQLYHSDIISLLEKYTRRWDDKIDKIIPAFDSQFIYDIIENIKNSNVIQVGKICKYLIKKYNRFSIKIDIDYSDRFKSKEWLIYTTLAEKDYETDEKYEDREKRRKEKIVQFADNLRLEEIDDFVEICNKIVLSIPDESWSFNDGLSTFCLALSNRKDALLKFIDSLLIYGNDLEIYPSMIYEKLFSYYGVSNTYEFINSRNFPKKNLWLFTFFEALPFEEVNEYWVNEFLAFLTSDSDKNIDKSSYRNLKILDKFTKYSPEIYVIASNLIFQKHYNNDFMKKIYFSLLFNKTSFKPQHLLEVYKSDISLLQKIYFHTYMFGDDYSGLFIKTFIEADKSWLELYVRFIIDHFSDLHHEEYNRIKACWLSDDYIEIFDYFFYQIIKAESLYDFEICSIVVHSLFHQSNEDVKIVRQREWIKHIILENYMNDTIYMIFNIISELDIQIRKECIELFIQYNSRFSVFEKLTLESSSLDFSGSMIPYMQARIKFYELLLPLFSGIEFIEHKKLLLERIKMWQMRIEQEQIDEISMELYM